MTAGLWGLSLAGPEIGVANAEDGVSSSSTGSDDADSSGANDSNPSSGTSGTSGEAGDTAGDAGKESEDEPSQTVQHSFGSTNLEDIDADDDEFSTDGSDISDSELDLDAEDSEEGDGPIVAATASFAGSASHESDDPPAEFVSRSDTAPSPEVTAASASSQLDDAPVAAASPVLNAPPTVPDETVSEESVQPSSNTVAVTSTQSLVISLDPPSDWRLLVNGQIAGLMGIGHTLVSILPLPAPVKDWLNASLAGTRRTLFNQAPWINPIQISGDGALPIVGNLGAVDFEGDEMRYSIVSGPASGTVTIDAFGVFTYTPITGFTGVDNFVVAVTDLGAHVNLFDPFRSASTQSSLLVNQSAVTFLFNYTTGSHLWSAEARAALQRAAIQLVGHLVVRIPVVVTYDITGQNSSSTNTLASVDSPLIGSGAGFFPTVVQHKLLTGVDSNGAAADGAIDWNFAYPWAFGDSVGILQYDFTTVAMHEFLHSFGFMSYVQQSTITTQRRWTTYDRQLRALDGTPLIGGDYRLNPALTAALQGANGGLYFGGTAAVDAYGALVPVYTPATWTEGSSISHLDGTRFTGTNRQLMNPQVPTGPGIRTLSAIERGIMEDLGYTLAPLNATSALAFVGFVFLRRRRESVSA